MRTSTKEFLICSFKIATDSTHRLPILIKKIINDDNIFD